MEWGVGGFGVIDYEGAEGDEVKEGCRFMDQKLYKGWPGRITASDKCRTTNKARVGHRVSIPSLTLS